METSLTVERKPWSDDITRTLAHPASEGCLSLLEREVRAGISDLWECRGGPDVLYVITRVDQSPLEWVICYAQGTGLARFSPLFIAYAARRGWPLRVHTTNRATVRLLRRFGFSLSEFVLRR